MAQEVNNSEDILDSRDVIERFEELEAQKDEPDGLDESEVEELKALKEFIEEGSGEWPHGETLVRESYFVEYAQELAEELDLIPKEFKWPVYCIDWEYAARELKHDYTSADFDGVTYYYRAS